MKTLSPGYRKRLERAVVEARDIAETGARIALEALAVHHHESYAHMDSHQRTLRRRLRAHARHLGDRADARSGRHTIDHLVHECAYEHWHGMLFARFLAENYLLIEPEMDVAITLDECEELAKKEGTDKWTLAARFAHRMLPQVFRPDHPVFEVQLAREYRLKLEGLVGGLPSEVFTATDALGWVYQFWQSKKKEEINRSEVKIGADELPAVTQLFTEPYMVQFLLENSLGAWWVSRYPDKVCPVDLPYLRRTEDGAPVAGGFEDWPDDLSEFRLLDPCCGSGHFLVAAFLMLVPMRVARESLSAAEAIDAVLRDNLHGLELDSRCVAIAAFALALEAWRYPDAGGFRSLTKPNLAWCGQPIVGRKEQWLVLAGGNQRLESGMAALYDTFRDAPTLGSLIAPAHSVSEDLLTAGFAELQPFLEKALREYAGDEEREETAIAATGLSKAARLLAAKYDLVVTNVPYLARGRQSQSLQKFCEKAYPLSRRDLATVFVERCLALTTGAGKVVLVCTQYWLFLSKYRKLREHLLGTYSWDVVAKLGTNAFEGISGEAVNVCLFLISSEAIGNERRIVGLDCTTGKTTGDKAACLQKDPLVVVEQLSQLRNPDHVISLTEIDKSNLLSAHVYFYHGISTTDYSRFGRKFWELQHVDEPWIRQQSTVKSIKDFSGREHVLFWENNQGGIRWLADQGATVVITGLEAWNKLGIAVSQMGVLPATRYTGEAFDDNVGVLIPKKNADAPAIWSFCTSPAYEQSIREIDQSFKVTYPTLAKVTFDLPRWQAEAKRRYPNGLPRPYSVDPTQSIFHGHPCGSVEWSKNRKWTAHGLLRADATVLQVAVARLLGYRWPAEKDVGMELADEQREWVRRSQGLLEFSDTDGIVCIPSVRAEPPAGDRLLGLLVAAFGDAWNDGLLAKLLAAADSSSLDDWLCNPFFEDHCKLFHHRPFLLHIWDGRKRDGFHALVNYHKLVQGDGKGRQLLESLTYSYLGNWISHQQDGVKRGEGGAEDRLAAALELQKRLVAVLDGEPPCDIFIRWKPIEAQPIGWEPDINDGVRLNIRPFMALDLPGGKRGAGILRAKPSIHWRKDRGKEPVRDQAHFPWFWKEGKFTGERVNDVHLTNGEKRAAREAAGLAAART